MRHIVLVIVFCSLAFFYACESSEEISRKMDHEVPSYKVLTDSLIVSRGQEVEIKVEVSDNAGLARMMLTYGNWGVQEVVTLAELNYPKTYLFVTKVRIPDDAAKEWIEDFMQNDGYVYKITQKYHKLKLEATDINMNVRNIPIYLKVQ